MADAPPIRLLGAIRQLSRARWSVRKDYAECRLNENRIGWWYARAYKVNRCIIWQPRIWCIVKAALDFLRRVSLVRAHV